MKIDKDIPPPPTFAKAEAKKRPVGRPMEYPWGDMQPGDSVLLETAQRPPAGSLQSWEKKNKGQKFIVRKNPSGGFRVWRIT